MSQLFSNNVFPVLLMIMSAALSTLATLPASAAAAPRIVLWSWEHNDDLRFVDTSKVAIAHFEGTIILGRETASIIKRRNLICLPASGFHFPVFRIELAHRDEAAQPAAFARAETIILDHLIKSKPAGCRRSQLAAYEPTTVQIDFDAKQNDRASYLQFLQNLKAKLPRNTKLSVTALASWCLGDKWLQQAGVDETVAMLFSMGVGYEGALSAMSRMPLSNGGSAKQSIGISINEEKTNRRLKKLGILSSDMRASKFEHLYAFSSLGWTKRRYEKLIEEVTAIGK